MPVLTPEVANNIVGNREDAYVLGDHRKYGYRYRLLKPNRREINIDRRPRKEGISVYINLLSCALESFPVAFPARHFPGVVVREEYAKGSTPSKDRGLSSSALSCPTLNPVENDVLRLSCTDRSGFELLLKWYAGELTLNAGEAVDLVSDVAISSSELATRLQPDSSSDAVGRTDSAEPTDAPGSTSDGQAASVTLSEEEELRQMSDPARRLAVERHAEDLAVALYEAQGFEVTRLGKPYDLLCTPTERCQPGTPIIHVECKGSVGRAAKVHLTRNEVEDARNEEWRSDLFIVANIRTEKESPDSAWRALGGNIRRFINWQPEDSALVPTDFEYKVPCQLGED